MTANAIMVVIKLMKAYLRKRVKLVDIINIINYCQLIDQRIYIDKYGIELTVLP